MIGWLIYNGSLKMKKFMEIHEMYVKSAAEAGIHLVMVENREVTALMENDALKIKIKPDIPDPDFILFLDKDIRLAGQLEALGYRLFNSAEAIRVCDDKILTAQVLGTKHIPMPKTVFSPLVFPGVEEPDVQHFIETIEREFQYPIIVKEAFGSFGAQVYLVRNRSELLEKRKKLLYTPHLYQEFIEESRGKDVRLYVVGDRVVTGMMRTNERDFRANVTNGGTMHTFDPPEAFSALAVRASKAVGAAFSGVDLLFGKDGNPLVCEVNSNAHIKNVYDCTGIDVSEYIFRYIKEQMNDV